MDERLPNKISHLSNLVQVPSSEILVKFTGQQAHMTVVT